MTIIKKRSCPRERILGPLCKILHPSSQNPLIFMNLTVNDLKSSSGHDPPLNP